MEEDVGAKAPVTRLRRRLSLEVEDVKSPSAPSTPNKKRGGRLAAKPQLELIDENSSDLTPNKSKKTAKNVVEASEEKVLTPARRSTRIKSNTSIVSDTPQTFDSPRAKRAARRNSQIGSDNETPVTPARPTRRTRKDSTTSVDKQETASEKITPPRVEVTIEVTVEDEVDDTEQESSIAKQIEKSETTPPRKSSRLLKKDKRVYYNKNGISLKEINAATDTNKSSNRKISDDSFQLINNLNDQPVYKASLNKSTSSVDSKTSKRNRTKTWTATKDSPNVNNNVNNNEIIKNDAIIKRLKSKISEIENTIMNNNNNNVDGDVKNVSSKDKQSVSIDNKPSDSLHKESNQEITELNETQKMLKVAPVAAVQSFIYYDDSDSDSKGKAAITDIPVESEDQCVPVVPEINQKSIFSQNENDIASHNDTCEPMDIDETIPENVSLICNTECKPETASLDKSENNNKSTIYSPNPYKSKRDSTSSLSTSQNNEKVGNENKSTLILSQLKDVSATDNSLSKSPKTTVGFLSKSVNEVNKDKDAIAALKKDSHDYMTSTPLQQKNLKKMAIQINDSVISNPNNTSTNTSITKNDNKNVSKKSNKSSNDSSEESGSEDVSREKSGFLDDEAEEASDDYESGDSRDEEDRQYEEENEIVEKGETLDSNDSASNDTDYEKDSFVVSSEEEDNELLSGTGDDLSMSDKELTQSKKSKKKFNDRKLKEQKKASREMFEARHNISNNSTKSDVMKGKKKNRQRLNSSILISEEEEIVVKNKKNKRMKLDSSQDSNPGDALTDSKEAETNVSLIEEHEITSVCNESVMNKKDPLSLKVKSEPQTPLKDMNLSTVPIHDQIEEIEVDQNVSVMKPNETSDPLEDDSDASSISENMEIASNYDSVLKDLNNVNEKKMKTLDMSLNLNKKAKQSAKPPIVDNLNLTNTKKSNNKIKESSFKEAEKQNEFEESSSDSIDLQLLFSEGSCDSEMKETKDQKKTKQETENFIPLKRTEAKTNILEDNTQEENVRQKTKDSFINNSNSDSFNISLNKKKNRKSVSDDIASEKSNITLNTNHETSVTSILDISSKKKKKNKLSISNTDGQNDEANSNNVKEKLNASQKEANQSTIAMNASLNISSMKNDLLNTSSKKKKHSISVSDETEAVNDVVSNVSQNETNVSLNNTLDKSSKKKKKKKHNISIDVENDTTANEQVDFKESVNNNNQNKSMNDTLNTSSKKNKKSSLSVSEDNDKKTDINTSLNISSRKKNISVSAKDEPINPENKSFEDLNVNTSTTESSKKKKKKDSVLVTGDVDTNSALNTSSKTNNISVSAEDEPINEDSNVNTSTNEKNKKKKKKGLLVTEDVDTNSALNTSSKTNNISVPAEDEPINEDSNVNTSTNEKTKNKKKKGLLVTEDVDTNSALNTSSKKKNISGSAEDEQINSGNKSFEELNVNTSTTESTKKKKKKGLLVTEDVDTNSSLNTSSRKNNISVSAENESINEDSNVNTSTTESTKKKKKKGLLVTEDVDTNNALNNSSRKNNFSVSAENEPINEDSNVNTSTTESSKKKKKKGLLVTEDVDTNSALNTSSKKDKIINSLEDEPIPVGNKSLDDLNASKSSKKKKKSNNDSLCEEIDKNTNINAVDLATEDFDVQTERKKKKKKKKHDSTAALDITASEGNDNVEHSPNSSAKKKKKTKAVDLETTDKVSRDDDSDAAPEEIPYDSHKNTSANDLSGYIFEDTEGNRDWNTQLTADCSKKKKNKKKKHRDTAPDTNDTTEVENNGETSTLKKRKRKSSTSAQEEIANDTDLVTEPVNVENKKKKQKIIQPEDTSVNSKDTDLVTEPVNVENKKKKHIKSQSEDTSVNSKEAKKKKTKKRKNRDDDEENKTSKVFKQDSTDSINVPRLPSSILNQLEDKPKKELLEQKKAKVLSTTQFVVEKTIKRKNKPSNYLEESIYMNDTVDDKKQKRSIEIPKVLPFVPTATISDTGFTTKFQMYVLEKESKFVAQTSNLTGFKNDYLTGKKIKKVGTYEMYKSQRNRKLAKF